MLNVNLGQDQFFPIVGLKVSNRCRMLCKFCCEADQTYPQYSVKDYCAILDKLHAGKVKRICFTGGEPLLNPNIEEIIKYSSCLGFENIMVSSDGALLKKMCIPVKYLPTIRLSIHGKNWYHDEMAGVQGAFHELETSIVQLVDKSYHVHVSTVVTPKVLDQLEDIVQWCIDLGVERFYLLNMLQSGRGTTFINENGMVGSKEFELSLNRLCEAYSHKIKLIGHPYTGNAECILVYGNGDVLIDPCFDSPTYQKVVGNLCNESPLSIMERFRKDEPLWSDYLKRMSRATVNLTE